MRAACPKDGIAVVRIWQANIGKTIVAHVPVTNGAVQETGDFELDGVTFPAAEVQLEFMDPAAEDEGDGGGSMFPTGHLVDELEVPGVGTLKATMINAGIPTDLRERGGHRLHRHRAAGRHQRRSEGARDVRDHPRARRDPHGTDQARRGSRETPAHAEGRLRREARRLRGLQRQADFSADVDLKVRALSMGKLHHAMMGTAAVAIGTAAAIPGTLVNLAAGGGARPRCASAILPARLRVGAEARQVDGRLDRDQGHHEPQRARADGGLGPRAGRRRLKNWCKSPIPGCKPCQAEIFPIFRPPAAGAARRPVDWHVAGRARSATGNSGRIVDGNNFAGMQVGDVRLKAHIDTGGYKSLGITRAALAKLEVEFTGTTTTRTDLNGVLRRTGFHHPRASTWRAYLQEPTGLRARRGEFRRHVRLSFDMVVGLDSLGQYAVIVDYPANRIELHDPATKPCSPGDAALARNADGLWMTTVGTDRADLSNGVETRARKARPSSSSQSAQARKLPVEDDVIPHRSGLRSGPGTSARFKLVALPFAGYPDVDGLIGISVFAGPPGVSRHPIRRRVRHITSRNPPAIRENGQCPLLLKGPAASASNSTQRSAQS